jgi:hypothetical protein
MEATAAEAPRGRDGAQRLRVSASHGPTAATPTAEPGLYDLPDDLLAAYHRLLDKKFREGLSEDESAELIRIGQQLDAADASTQLEQSIDARARREHERLLTVLTEVNERLKSLEEAG